MNASPLTSLSVTASLRAARAAADRLAQLLASEHGAMADFLLDLVAFDAARGWAELGHANLFAFLHRQLGLSRGAAYYRSAAARLVRRQPAVAEALRDGRLCLSSAAELARVLTPENEAEVLPRFFRLSAREAKEVVAGLLPHPRPPLREVVRAVAQMSSAASLAEGLDRPVVHRPGSGHVRPDCVQTSELALAQPARNEAGCAAKASSATVLPTAAPTAMVPVAPRSLHDTADPLTGDLSRLHVTVSRRFLRKLEAAREARAHARPGASTESILEEALDLLLAREEKRRSAGTVRPRRAPARAAAPREPEPPVEPSQHRVEACDVVRHVPAQVRRGVWARDGGRCAWPLDGGGTCGSTHRLQLDHVIPVARGGPSTVANLRVICEAHNREAARRIFGEGWLAGRIAPP